MAATRNVKHYVGGEWRGDAEAERRNPATPGEVVSISPEGSAADVAAAIAAAGEAQPGWARLPAPERARILADAGRLLAERAETVASDLTREEGKTIAEATGEVTRAAAILEFYAGQVLRISGSTYPSPQADIVAYTRHEPLGVVGVITPWNFPIAIPAWKIAPALAAGNAVVWKPAGLTPATADNLARALADAGLPAGVLNVVYGAGRVVGEAIVGAAEVSAVSFTGSTGVGSRIGEQAARRLARVQLEMGGKNALVVLDDADFERAVEICLRGAFGLTGQACTATSRLLATPAAAAAMVAGLERRLASFEPGDGLLAATGMGPVVSESQLRTDLEFIEGAVAAGAELAAGGDHVAGQLLRPAVLVNVSPEHRLAREEVFGPVLAVIEVADLEEAIAVANDTEYGLSSGICTTSLGSARAFADGVEAGVVKVNQPTSGLDFQVPFGGVKSSSSNTYRELGPGATDFYTWTKTVYLDSGTS